MNNKSHKIIWFAVVGLALGWCLMWAAQTFGGQKSDAIAPKPSQLTSEQFKQRGGYNRVYDELMYQSSKPTKPDRGSAFKEFNKAFDKHEQYKADVIDWRIRGHELRQKYNDPCGFNHR